MSRFSTKIKRSSSFHGAPLYKSKQAIFNLQNGINYKPGLLNPL